MSTYRVRLEPPGDVFECDEDETVLEAAFRHGFNLGHGCREGRCSACKAYILEGYAYHKPHSSFALSEGEEEEGYSLLCRALPESDLHVELLHFDAEAYRLEVPISEGRAVVTAVEALTHDITFLALEVEAPSDFTFRPGQYVDLRVPRSDERRSYSMSNLPGEGRLEFVIKRYPDGLFSGLLEGAIKVGDCLTFVGPYGTCCLRPASASRNILLIAGGSGMAPVLSLLRQIVRDRLGGAVRFFYGGRARRDLFYGETIADLGGRLDDFEYVPVLSDLDEGESWAGEQGFVHEAVGRWFARAASAPSSNWEVYMAGPQVMVYAALEMLTVSHRLEPASIFFDAFTSTGRVDEGE